MEEATGLGRDIEASKGAAGEDGSALANALTTTDSDAADFAVIRASYETPREQYIESPSPLKISEILDLWDGVGDWTRAKLIAAFREQDWRYCRDLYQSKVQMEREAVTYNVDGKFQDRIRDYQIAGIIRDIEDIDQQIELGMESVITRGGIPVEVPLRPESKAKLLATKVKLNEQLAKRVGIETLKIEVDMNEQGKWQQKKDALLAQEDPQYAALLQAAGQPVPALPPAERDITDEVASLPASPSSAM